MHKSKRKIIIWVVVAVIIVLIIFRIVTSANNNTAAIIDETANVKVTNAAISSIEVTSPITGRIQPLDEVSIVPKAPGEVTKIYVALGDKVQKGALLFTLDASQMQSALAQANAGLAQANAGLAQSNEVYNQAITSYNNAKDNFNRTEALYKQGAVSKQQYDQALFQLDTALAAVNQAKVGISSAKAGISSAKAGISSASSSIGNTKVTAPISGYITSVNVAEGGMASQAVAAVSIADIDMVEINCSVSENLINKIKVGETVKVVIKSVSDQQFDGVITNLSPAPATGSLTYPIKISINNPNAQIKPGMFAEVIVASEKLSDVLTLPSDAVIIKGGKTVVATISSGKVLFKEVVCGLDNGQRVEIQSGIAAGDSVVYEGQYYLENEDPVNVIQ